MKKWVRKVGGREQRKENGNKGMVKKWVSKVGGREQRKDNANKGR